MEFSGSMTSTMNATSTDECEENAMADKCDVGNI